MKIKKNYIYSMKSITKKKTNIIIYLNQVKK